MQIAYAIFVKTPGLSPVKTRLAKDIGAVNAADFYRLSAEAVQQTVQLVMQRTRIKSDAFWAVAENDHGGYWSGFPVIPQGPGNLNARIHSVTHRLLLNFDWVFILGADCPQIQYQELLAVHKDLDKYDAVVGPTLDGGFWTFGSHSGLAFDAWQRVPMSDRQTLRGLERELKNIGAIGRLATHVDVDHGVDLVTAIRHLDKIAEPTEAQQTLLQRFGHTADRGSVSKQLLTEEL